MQLYFIRHAQSENNLLWAQTGSWEGRNEDPDLTPIGRKQSEALAGFLKQPGLVAGSLPVEFDTQNIHGFALTHLYCSLMIRAVATAMVVSRALGLPLVGHNDLHEVGGIHRRDEQSGKWFGLPGRSRADFSARYPELILPESVGEAGWWNRPSEQEDQAAVRAQGFLSDLLAQHGSTDHRVAVFSHGGFYNHVVRAILGIPADAGHWFSLNNVAITRFDLAGEGTWVAYMNRIDFVPRELVT